MIARTIRKVATGGSAPIAQTGIRSMKPTQNGSWTRKVGASASAAPACDIEAAAFAKSCIDYPFGGYKRLLEEQRGLCAICRGPSGRRALGVDHDHDRRRAGTPTEASVATPAGRAQDDAGLMIDDCLSQSASPGPS